MEKITFKEVEANPSLTPCLEDGNLDMEMGNKLMESPNVDGIEGSILHSNSGIIPEPDIDMDRSTAPVAQKQQGPKQSEYMIKSDKFNVRELFILYLRKKLVQTKQKQ